MATRNKISRATAKSLGVKCNMAFDAEQRGIRNGALGALATSLALFSACLLFNCPVLQVADAGHEKAKIALIAALLAGSLAVAIMRLANQRFYEPLDRNAAAASTATEKATQLQAILRNTHEQVTIAVLVYAIAFLLMPAAWTDTIFAAAILFASGRFFFARGYSKGAAGRAFGFGLSFYPSVLLALLSLYAPFF